MGRGKYTGSSTGRCSMRIERHRFHAICPYFAMFPERFVEDHLHRTPADTFVFDPFCGRGTTVFEALRHGRSAAGSDISPVAVCVSRAKASPPTRNAALKRVDELSNLPLPEYTQDDVTEFFKLCYHSSTFKQILMLRRELDWENSIVDCFLSALMLGSLHGESHKSSRYLSNRMPRTISTKPGYSIAWWQKHNLLPPQRDAFALLREMIDYRFATPPPFKSGEVKKSDVRNLSVAFPHLVGKVGLVITSPPYLDTTNFAEDQWLRLWFLNSASESKSIKRDDHRHFGAMTYWNFLADAWAGLSPLLSDKSTIVVRIGGRKVSFEEAEDRLKNGLKSSINRSVNLIESRTSVIKTGQLRSFRPSSSERSFSEHDFVFSL